MKTSKKKQITINNEAVAEQLSKDSTYNWIISEGLTRISQGKPIGKNMEFFLSTVGVIEYK